MKTPTARLTFAAAAFVAGALILLLAPQASQAHQSGDVALPHELAQAPGLAEDDAEGDAEEADGDASEPGSEEAEDGEAQAPAEAGTIDIVLIDGQRLLGAKLTAVTEMGVEFTLQGTPWQLQWQLLRPEPLLQERKKLVDVGDSLSVESYAIWAESFGLEQEFAWADEIYMELNEGRSLRKPIDPIVEMPDDPEVTDPEGGDETTPPDEGEKPQPAASTVLTVSCEDAELKELIVEYLGDYGYKIDDSAANTTLQVKAEWVLVGRSDFFGDVLFATYNLKLSINVTDSNKAYLAGEELESGEMKAKSDQLSKDSCRNAAAIRLLNWVDDNIDKR